jgi:hypothetical protein
MSDRTPKAVGICEVGKPYLVPCVRASSTPPSYARPGDWVPVLLPEHEDREIIGVPYAHYHLDFRFLSDRQHRLVHLGSIMHRDLWPTPKPGLTLYVGELEYRRKKCRRRMPINYPHHLPTWYPRLEKAYTGACMVNRRCPHKGIDLSGCEARNGVILCPGHGLMWDEKTGEQVTVAEAYS